MLTYSKQNKEEILITTKKKKEEMLHYSQQPGLPFMQRIWIEAYYVPSAVLEAFVELITDRRTVRSSKITSVQFSSVAQLCPTLCNPMDCSTPKII